MNIKQAARKVLEDVKLLDKREDPTHLPVPETADCDQPRQGPALIAIHGIQQRSGTVFLGELLRLHPRVEAFPQEIWEAPLLNSIHHLENFENEFFQLYEQNKDILPKHYFAQLLGRAFLEAIQETLGKTVLLKNPSVQHLKYFPKMFPGQQLVILIRDGRDNVASMIKTWPNIEFESACHQWANAAEEIVSFQQFYGEQPFYTVIRFEDLLHNQDDTLLQLLERLNLPSSEYPFKSTNDIQVIGSSDTAEQGEANWEGVKKTSQFSPENRWANWSSEQIDQFNAIAGAAMQALGYSD